MNKEISIPKLKRVRDKWFKQYFGVELYDYQRQLSDSIIEAVFDKEKDIDEIAIEFSRQSGKTSTVVYTIAFIMVIFKLYYGTGIRIGIFAPQREQAKTDFDRLKDCFFVMEQKGLPINYKEANATTLRPDISLEGEKESEPAEISIGVNNEVFIFPISKNSHPESKTLDLIIVEESQDIDDHNAKTKVFPMGASTNAPRIFIGTAGFRICYFQQILTKEGATKHIFPFDKVIEDKKKMFEKTGDHYHLNYGKYIEKEKMRLGEDSDEFRSQYKLEWILGAGQFVTKEVFDKLVGEFGRCYQNKDLEAYAGIDTAKDPDSTVVTVVGYDREKKQKRILNWLELRGDNYLDQFQIIWEFLNHYKVRAVAIDSTGQGDFMPDMFERETWLTNEQSGLYRVKFSMVSKDIIYKNLLTQIKEFLTAIPKMNTKEAERFQEQLLNLQKEYKGNFLSCHHPDDINAHDDYPDSWALAEYAFFKYNEKQPELTVIDPARNASEQIKKENEKVVDDWQREDLWH